MIGAAGAVGSSTLWHLARAGVRVVGIDQFDVAHAFGSSHGLSRVIRQAYFEDAAYVPLARSAFARWRDLEQVAGQPLLEETGALYIGPGNGSLISGSLRTALEHRLEHEMLSDRQLSQRFPMLRVSPEYVAFYEPRAGFLRPESAIEAMLGQALRHGAQFLTSTKVHSWRSNGARCELQTDRGTIEADKLVIAAGAWASKVIPGLPGGVRPTVRRALWVRPGVSQVGALPPCVWAIDTGTAETGFIYGFPPTDAITSRGHSDLIGTLKFARHDAPTAETIDADQHALAQRDHTQERVMEQDMLLADRASVWVPALAGEVVAARSCLYETSPDEHFMLDVHPAHENVVVAAGLSGHGFKFASVIGEIVAQLTLSGTTEHPIAPFRVSRFANHTPHRS